LRRGRHSALLPKRLWDWVDAAQYTLAENGAVGAASPLDLMVCATAAHHGLIVLHDDADFVTVARLLPDVSERNVRGVPDP
jgi:predicted nucleic acid-binding protein